MSLGLHLQDYLAQETSKRKSMARALSRAWMMTSLAHPHRVQHHQRLPSSSLECQTTFSRPSRETLLVLNLLERPVLPWIIMKTTTRISTSSKANIPTLPLNNLRLSRLPSLRVIRYKKKLARYARYANLCFRMAIQLNPPTLSHRATRLLQNPNLTQCGQLR